MTKFINLISFFSKACGIFAAFLVGAAILVVCQMVVMRYFLNASTIWQTEFVIYSLVASTFIGSPYVLLIKGHVNVDLLPHYLGQKGRHILAMIASILGFLFCFILWIPYISFPIGIGLLSVQYIADIISLATGRSMPFAMDHHSALEGK